MILKNVENELSPMKELLLEKSLKLVQSMTYFGMNILKNSRLANNIFKLVDETTVEFISQVSKR